MSRVSWRTTIAYSMEFMSRAMYGVDLANDKPARAVAWVLPGSLPMTRLLLHVNLENARPARELARTTAPVLLIYSEQDQCITAEMRQEMSAARPNTQVWIVPEGLHAEIYNGQPQEYAERVAHFLDRALL